MQRDRLKSMISTSDNIVFFGGAGVSTESNIPDFRSASGLYQTDNPYSHPPEVMVSHSFFHENTEEFFRFYRDKLVYSNAKPNAAHIALARLEKMGKLKAVITQNIDGLHQVAGSKNVIELHGSVQHNYCLACGKEYTLEYILATEGIPHCQDCQGIVRPDVVLYEESLKMEVIHQAIQYISDADLFIVGGTSLVVYPAAGLVRYYSGDKLVLINKSHTPYDAQAVLAINDSIGKVLSAAVP